MARAAYVLRGGWDPLNLDEVLDDLLVTDPQAGRRREVKTYYLGTSAPGQAAAPFLEAARPYV